MSEPVLILGGGIGGIAAALALARRGIPSRVLEKAAEFREVGAGIQIGPNAFGVFEALGLTQAIDRVAHYPDALIMRDSLTGEEVTRVPLGEGFRARFKRPYAVIHRADLLDALVAAARGEHAIELLNGREVVDFAERGEGVEAVTAGGERHRGRALIAADGLWSLARERIVGDGKPRVSGHIAYRAVLKASDVPAGRYEKSVVLWGGQRRHLVHYPLRRGELYNLVAVFHSQRYEEGWDSYGDPAELRERFADAFPAVRELLGKIESWRMWVLCDREPVKDWSRGRVTLLGDAAHPMLQYLAQGAVMAMEDAWVLAGKLAAANDPAAAFQAYQAERYLRTARVQLTARFYGDIYHATDVTRELRNQLLSGRNPEAAYEGMAWLYDGIAGMRST